jgi:hypothetical protein
MTIHPGETNHPNRSLNEAARQQKTDAELASNALRMDRLSSQNTPDATTEFIPVIRRGGSPAQRAEAFTSTPLHEAAGRHFAQRATDPRFHNHIPAHVIANPDNAAAREIVPGSPNNPNVPKSHRGRNTLIALAATGVMGAGAIGVYSAIEEGSERAVEKMFPNKDDTTSQINEAPTPPEYVGNLKVSYKDTPAMETMNQLSSQWAHDLPLARDIMLNPAKPFLTDEQKQLLSQPIPDKLSNATNQQLENINSYQLFDSTSQGDQTETLGRQFVTLAMDPRNPHISAINQDITEGKRGDTDVYQALSNHPEMHDFTFENEHVADGWVVEARDVSNGVEVDSVFERVESNDGAEHLVLRNSFDRNAPEAQAEIHRLFGNS